MNMMGTPIQDLQNNRTEQYDNIRKLQEMQQAHYGALQNLQNEQAHNAQDNMHQAQHQPYYDCENCKGYPKFINARNQEHETPDIEDITREISKSLKDDTLEGLVDSTEQQEVNEGYISYIPKLLREPLLILVLYIILSHSLVRESIGKYVSQTVPNEEGVVTFTGILIYGILFASIFALIKHFAKL